MHRAAKTKAKRECAALHEAQILKIITRKKKTIETRIN